VKLSPGTTPSRPMKCSMAWTKSPVKPNGLLYSASWSNALLQRLSSTSSYSGETPSQPGHPQAPVSFRSVIVLILTSLHQAMEQLKQLKTPYPLPRVCRSEARRTSPNQCARTSGSGKSIAPLGLQNGHTHSTAASSATPAPKSWASLTPSSSKTRTGKK